MSVTHQQPGVTQGRISMAVTGRWECDQTAGVELCGDTMPNRVFLHIVQPKTPPKHMFTLWLFNIAMGKWSIWPFIEDKHDDLPIQNGDFQ